MEKTDKERYMDNLDIVVHETDEGGYWAEIPAMPGCITEGDTLEETKANIREAAEVWLATKLEWILTRGTVKERPEARELVCQSRRDNHAMNATLHRTAYNRAKTPRVGAFAQSVMCRTSGHASCNVRNSYERA